MVVLVGWIGLMGLLAAVAGWVILSRFPEVFFSTDDWRKTRKGRVSRMVVIGLVVLFGLVILGGMLMLLPGGRSD